VTAEDGTDGGQFKIENLGVIAPGDRDIRGFDIAMDNARAVNRVSGESTLRTGRRDSGTPVRRFVGRKEPAACDRTPSRPRMAQGLASLGACKLVITACWILTSGANWSLRATLHCGLNRAPHAQFRELVGNVPGTKSSDGVL
jgi:hypothetical protein